MEANNILERLKNGEELQPIAGYAISNSGGILIYYADSECVVIQYPNDPPEICEIRYDMSGHLYFRVGELKIMLNECITFSR